MLYTKKKVTKRDRRDLEKTYGRFSDHIISYVEEMIRVRSLIDKAICRNHEGKMEGMLSLSTSPLMNQYCVKRRKVDSMICSHCFSCALGEQRTTLKEKLKRNTKILTEKIYPIEFFPTLNVLFFRLESFGDLNNATQLINFFHLCLRNPLVRFTLWTKNTFILKKVRKLGYSKPKNLIIIQSSFYLNKVDPIRDQWVDKVFTVFDKVYAAEHNIAINCGARHCLSCETCYTDNDTIYINELLKP